MLSNYVNYLSYFCFVFVFIKQFIQNYTAKIQQFFKFVNVLK